MFKNKYLQKRFGECVYVCLANAFNLPAIIDKCEDRKGLNWLSTRNLVEMTTPYTTQTLLSLDYPTEPSRFPVQVFDLCQEFNTNEDIYVMFLLSVPSTKPGFTHCVLAIRKNFDPTLTILDPKKEEPHRVSCATVGREFQVTKVETFCNAEHGGVMFFNAAYLSHLITPISP